MARTILLFTVSLCILLAVNYVTSQDFEFELRGDIKKTIPQTEAMNYEEEGYFLVDHHTTGRRLKVSYTIPDDLLNGVYNMDGDGYRIEYKLLDERDNVLSTQYRYRRVSDVNECELKTDKCDRNAHCVNTLGSYDCFCNEGWEGNGISCQRILNCLNGYQRIGDKCVDIDECAIGIFECARGAKCVNTEGSYRCECEAGFEGDGKVCVKRGGTIIELNHNPSHFKLGERYIEYGYKLVDRTRSQVDIQIEPEDPLKVPLAACGTYYVDYSFIHPETSKPQHLTRTVYVTGHPNICSSELFRGCQEYSKCSAKSDGCGYTCNCIYPYVNDPYNPDICIDGQPPRVICPQTPILFRECYVCDKAMSEVQSVEEKRRSRCVAFDLRINSGAVDVNKIQRELNQHQNPSLIALPSDVSDVTSSIRLVGERKLNESCIAYSFEARDQQGNVGIPAEQIVCTNVVDMKTMKEHYDEVISDYGWTIRFLYYSIIATIVWLLILAFGEYATKIFYFIQVVIFGQTESYDRADVAYSFWFKLLHPFATDREVRHYVQRRINEDERKDRGEDDEDEDDDGEGEGEGEGDEDDGEEENEEEEEEEEEEENRKCSVM